MKPRRNYGSAHKCARCHGAFRSTVDPDGELCLPCYELRREEVVRSSNPRPATRFRFMVNVKALGKVIAQTALVLLVGGVLGAFLIAVDAATGVIW